MTKRKWDWLKPVKNADGSSIISVLVAFVMLLIGIEAFHTAISTSENLVRRAESLNAATGEVVRKFYENYPTRVEWSDFNYILTVYRVDKDGNSLGSGFDLHGKLSNMEFEATLPKDGGSGDETMTYSMYYYK